MNSGSFGHIKKFELGNNWIIDKFIKLNFKVMLSELPLFTTVLGN